MQTYHQNPYSKSVQISSTPEDIWTALSSPAHMQNWMSESAIEISSNWKTGEPISIKGILSGHPFENKGKVLKFDPHSKLEYSHLSSLSNLEDILQNYSIIRFSLHSAAQHSTLTIALSNFPTETIYKHLVFYWSTTLEILKQYIEKGITQQN